MNVPALPHDIDTQIARALAEDVGDGDLTASLIPADKRARATVISREDAVLCGRAWFDAVFRQLDPAIEIRWFATDGDRIAANQKLCELSGSARHLLTGERTALNFLQTLSATATATRAHVDAIAGTNTRVLDTRKTIPGLRLAQKYAVVCGGGVNHRIGLFDAILVKENHIAAAGSIAAAVAQARRIAGQRVVEVEVENLDELRQALATDIDRILIDNFTLEMMREAVAINRRHDNGRVKLEASGNVSMATIRGIAETGVDFISIGGLTKHVQAVDLSMRFVL
ncbi:MAG TPA: carboxylating nicotinate-nucleotide diphosphorylase [Povalibacter sp.]|uniref:carboxylating nicotinate-nucleotide diphosphorylase n=1 Tax=Povalibacter sp. TaxID=1962978 RepID=UPI002B85B628|nr:carboxylating nicotinate-nucleotide diphosphorylase [Povalibacter sp.]HMN44074.1 carboxylating nicotinate-nucleotide diphosphorylase [Povalibacter sp.]